MTSILDRRLFPGGRRRHLPGRGGRRVSRLPDFFLQHARRDQGGRCRLRACFSIGVAFADAFARDDAQGRDRHRVPAAHHAGCGTSCSGRAGYVGGAPLWARTVEDQLSSELPRGTFDRPHDNGSNKQARGRDISSVLLAIASGDGMDDAIETAIRFARSSGADLKALAIIDTKTLHNVGPVPLGGNHYAVQLRNTLTAQARAKVAEIVQSFERRATQAGVRFRVQMEEGDPRTVFAGAACRSCCPDRTTRCMVRSRPGVISDRPAGRVAALRIRNRRCGPRRQNADHHLRLNAGRCGSRATGNAWSAVCRPARTDCRLPCDCRLSPPR
jgi:nucleotide-binding universal stress UspA family protein/ribosomal protein S27AE